MSVSETDTVLFFDSKGQIRDSGDNVVGTIAIPETTLQRVDHIVKKHEESLKSRKTEQSILIDYFCTRSAEQLKKQVLLLKSLKQPEQRSPEWYLMRESRLTASDLAGAIGESTYDKPVDILEKKLGAGLPFTGNFATRWGQQYESVACDIYSAREGVTVEEFGLLPHPTIPFLGASPDGISMETSRMLEIKCPPKRQITGIVPRGYEIQMQLQLEVCDLEECDFEECKFDEYFGVSQFKNDSFRGDLMKTREGLEKGLMLELYDRETHAICYRYCPLGQTFEACQNWSVNQQRLLQQDSCPRFGFRKEIWWKLVVYSCVRVRRGSDVVQFCLAEDQSLLARGLLLQNTTSRDLLQRLWPQTETCSFRGRR